MAAFFWWAFFVHHFFFLFLSLFFPLLNCVCVLSHRSSACSVILSLLLLLLSLLLILNWNESLLGQLFAGSSEQPRWCPTTTVLSLVLRQCPQGTSLCSQVSSFKAIFPLEGDPRLHSCCPPTAPVFTPCLPAGYFQQRPGLTALFTQPTLSTSPLHQMWSWGCPQPVPLNLG